MENISTVILLGNGYDVAYGYCTKYSDFYLDELFLELCKTPNDLAKFIKKANEEKGKELWSDLEEELYKYSLALTNVKNNGDPCNLRLANKNDIFKLTDTEKKILSANNFYKDFNEIQDCLGKFIIKKTDHSQPILSDNYDNLRNLANEWLNENGKTLVISFNYTNLFWGRHSNSDVLYVHGTIHQLQSKHRGSYELEPTGIYKSHNIVLGIDESMNVETDHSFLYKAYNESTNIHNLASVLKNAKRYIIFGCSLGESDRWYFEKIFNKEQSGKFYEIYYYGTSGQLNINSRIKDISKASIADFKERNNVLYLDSSDIEKAMEKRRDYYIRFPYNF